MIDGKLYSEYFGDILSELGLENQEFEQNIDLLIQTKESFDKIKAYIEYHDANVWDIQEEINNVDKEIVKLNQNYTNKVNKYNNYNNEISGFENKIPMNKSIEIELQKFENELLNLNRQQELRNGLLAPSQLNIKQELESKISDLKMEKEDFINLKEEISKEYEEDSKLITELVSKKNDLYYNQINESIKIEKYIELRKIAIQSLKTKLETISNELNENENAIKNSMNSNIEDLLNKYIEKLQYKNEIDKMMSYVQGIFNITDDELSAIMNDAIEIQNTENNTNGLTLEDIAEEEKRIVESESLTSEAKELTSPIENSIEEPQMVSENINNDLTNESEELVSSIENNIEEPQMVSENINNDLTNESEELISSIENNMEEPQMVSENINNDLTNESEKLVSSIENNIEEPQVVSENINNDLTNESEKLVSSIENNIEEPQVVFENINNDLTNESEELVSSIENNIEEPQVVSENINNDLTNESEKLVSSIENNIEEPQMVSENINNDLTNESEELVSSIENNIEEPQMVSENINNDLTNESEEFVSPIENDMEETQIIQNFGPVQPLYQPEYENTNDANELSETNNIETLVEENKKQGKKHKLFSFGKKKSKKNKEEAEEKISQEKGTNSFEIQDVQTSESLQFNPEQTQEVLVEQPVDEKSSIDIEQASITPMQESDEVSLSSSEKNSEIVRVDYLPEQYLKPLSANINKFITSDEELINQRKIK